MGVAQAVNLLLDTHIFLWSLLEPEKLAQQVRHELESQENTAWISPITTWECLVLAQKGRISLEPDPETWVRETLRALPLREAPINHEIAIVSRTVGLPHQDPADRFLVATAMVFDLTLVTADERLLKAKGVSLMPNV